MYGYDARVIFSSDTSRIRDYLLGLLTDLMDKRETEKVCSSTPAPETHFLTVKEGEASGINLRLPPPRRDSRQTGKPVALAAH